MTASDAASTLSSGDELLIPTPPATNPLETPLQEDEGGEHLAFGWDIAEAVHGTHVQLPDIAIHPSIHGTPDLPTRQVFDSSFSSLGAYVTAIIAAFQAFIGLGRNDHCAGGGAGNDEGEFGSFWGEISDAFADAARAVTDSVASVKDFLARKLVGRRKS